MRLRLHWPQTPVLRADIQHGKDEIQALREKHSAWVRTVRIDDIERRIEERKGEKRMA